MAPFPGGCDRWCLQCVMHKSCFCHMRCLSSRRNPIQPTNPASGARMTTHRFNWMLFPIAALLVLGACATTTAPQTIADTPAANPQLTTLNKLINDAGLADTLRGPGPYTMFAPTDEAFKAVPAATLDAIAKDKERLKAVL